jgi:uncharacterized protein (TIGR02145 family)
MVNFLRRGVVKGTGFSILSSLLGGEIVAGGKLKEAGTVHWASPNISATNESGFTALPGGYREFSGFWGSMNFDGLWLSSTEINTNYAWFYQVDYNMPQLLRFGTSTLRTKRSGFSVRCLKDN